MAKKLRELILYIASQSIDDPRFSAIKLNKILFTIDFYAFGIFGHPVTESAYIRLRLGPCPKDMPRAQSQLFSEGRARLEARPYMGKTQKRVIALDQPDMSVFSHDETQLINQLIEELRPLNATEVSDWTHNLLPWLAATDMEEIPFYTVFLWHNKPVSREGISWAERRLSELRSAGAIP